jgi:hypothetical protein
MERFGPEIEPERWRDAVLKRRSEDRCNEYRVFSLVIRQFSNRILITTILSNLF